MTLNELLRCPECSGVLRFSDAHFTCVACNSTFGTWKGLPLLSSDPEYYYGEFDKVTCCELLERGDSVGASQAIRSMVRDGLIDDYRLHYALSPSRAGFLPLLNPGPNKRVLDVGCGWGALSLSLARAFGECYSLDLTKERVRFVSQRAQELGISNLHLLCAGDRRMPFADQTFDCAVINGVLEWVPEGRTGSATDHQKRYLSEVARILKPDGIIYLAIENRYALRYFLGFNEEHCKIRYASLLPRWGADLLSHKVRGRPYRNYTYSRSGYRKLLTQVGFGQPRFFVPYPSYTQIDAVLQPESLVDRRDFFGGASSSARGALKTALVTRMPHGLSIISTRGSHHPPEPWFERFSGHVRSQLKWPDLPVDAMMRVSHSGILMLVLRQQDRSCIAQITIGPQIGSSLDRARSGITMLQDRSKSRSLPFRFPKPLASGEFEGVRYFIQEHLNTNSPTSYEMDLKTATFRNWIKWSASQAFTSLCLDSSQELETFETGIQQSGIPLTRSIRDSYLRLLDDAGPLRVPCHANLWPGNIVNTSEGYGLISWGEYQSHGMPLHDVFNYHLFNKPSNYYGRVNSYFDSWTVALDYSEHGFPNEILKNLSASIDVVKSILPGEAWSEDRLRALFLLYVANRLVHATLFLPYQSYSAIGKLLPLFEASKLVGIRSLADL